MAGLRSLISKDMAPADFAVPYALMTMLLFINQPD